MAGRGHHNMKNCIKGSQHCRGWKLLISNLRSSFPGDSICFPLRTREIRDYDNSFPETVCTASDEVCFLREVRGTHGWKGRLVGEGYSLVTNVFS